MGRVRRCEHSKSAYYAPPPPSPEQSPKKGGVGLDGAEVCSVAIKLGFMSMPLVFRGTTR